MARRAWGRHGTLPADLFASLTPSQFMVLFADKPGSDRHDPLAALAALNADRGRKGLQPVFPSWFLNAE